ncbi:MAG: N-acetylgalactosamine 6-sulfate sulfatase, partial [Planctomycetota bacterium]
LTGQYPWRTGWVNHWDVPRWGVGYFDWEAYDSVARVLKKAGYATAIAGKWQINDFRLEPQALRKHGFDDWCVWTGYEGGNPPSAHRYWDPYINTPEGSRTYEGKFGPDLYSDFLCAFIRKHADEPMFLYYPMALTHGHLEPTPDEPDVTKGKELHAANVRYVDKLVGKLLAALEDAGVRDRTIVIFTCDNGTAGGALGTIGGHRPSGGKASKYEGGVCMPFIVSCPGLVPEGVVTDALIDFSDLLPTFAELAGAPLPDAVLDGKSFAPLVLGKADDSPRDWILAMGHGGGTTDAEGVRGVHDFADRVLRDKRYKVWVNTEKQIDQFYDLKNDPWEEHNLLDAEGKLLPEADTPEARAALAKFQQVVDAMPDRDARPQYRKRAPNPWDMPLGQYEKRAKESRQKASAGEAKRKKKAE